MLYLALKLLGNQSDAEDAVHRAFLALIKNVEKISDVDCPETRRYCVVIIRSKCFDILRHRQKVLLYDEFDDMPALVSDDSSLFEGCSPIVQAMSKINEKYRAVLYLKFVCGYESSEIAEMYDINTAAAQKLIWRAKEALRKVYENNGDE